MLLITHWYGKVEKLKVIKVSNLINSDIVIEHVYYFVSDKPNCRLKIFKIFLLDILYTIYQYFLIYSWKHFVVALAIIMRSNKNNCLKIKNNS